MHNQMKAKENRTKLVKKINFRQISYVNSQNNYIHLYLIVLFKSCVVVVFCEQFSFKINMILLQPVILIFFFFNFLV